MATPTIDIDDAVAYLKTGFVTSFTRLIVGESYIKMPWLSYFDDIVYAAVEWAVNLAATKGGLVAFMINTKIIAIDKSTDYIEAIQRVDSLPDDVDNETWEKAEREADKQFRNLIGLAA